MPDQLTDEQWEQIEAEIFAGRKIAAIKLIREHARVDLKEAKTIVEEHEQMLRQQSPDMFTTSGSSGCTVGLIALATGVVGVAMLG